MSIHFSAENKTINVFYGNAEIQILMANLRQEDIKLDQETECIYVDMHIPNAGKHELIINYGVMKISSKNGVPLYSFGINNEILINLIEAFAVYFTVNGVKPQKFMEYIKFFSGKQPLPSDETKIQLVPISQFKRRIIRGGKSPKRSRSLRKRRRGMKSPKSLKRKSRKE